jgi:hypothetical protein
MPSTASNMRKLPLAVAGLLVFLATPRVEAQAIESPYEFIETTHAITGFGGYLATNTGSLDLAPKSAPIFGARYNLHFTGPLSGELGMGFAPTDRTVYIAPGGAPATEIEPLGDISSVIFLMDAGLRFNLTGARTWHRLAPFLVGTIGLVADLTRTDPVEQSVEIDQLFEFGPGFAASLGLGSELFLSERFALRAEVRDYLWRLTAPGGLTETGRRETEWRHNFSFTFGGAIHF